MTTPTRYQSARRLGKNAWSLVWAARYFGQATHDPAEINAAIARLDRAIQEWKDAQ